MKLFLLIALLALTACSSNKTKPTEPVTTPPVVIELPETEIPPASSNIVTDIKNLVSAHPVSRKVWGNRGIAPQGFLKGVALTFARSVCNPHPVVASTTLGPATKDALAYYDLRATNVNVYAFMIGLGMRESSGKYCTGRDGSANNIQSDTAEGGVMQTSYDSRSADASLVTLFKTYNKNCYLEVFKEGVSCGTSYAKNWGTGADGLAFQEKVKSCPAFAMDYAAITMRVLRAHYGPINRREVTFSTEAQDLLNKVESLVKASPEACAAL